MSSKAKFKLRKRLLDHYKKPHSPAYRKYHAEAVAAGIRLDTGKWRFPDPAPRAAARATPPQPDGGGGGGGGGVQPADPDAAREAEKRERRRLKVANWRAKKKQKVAEENAREGRRAFQDVTSAQKRQAYRDRERIREDFAADPDLALRAVTLLVKSPDLAAATLEAAKAIDPVPFELAGNMREFLFVGREEIRRDGPLAKLEWMTKDRIQALHELRLVQDTVDLNGRDLVCRCPPCQGMPGECRYRAWVAAPRHISIELTTKVTGEQLREQCKCRTGRDLCLICAYVEDVSRRLKSGSEPA